jgi:multidrug efflux pump subunit AcrA (membrane-fusion protein)
VTAPADGIIVAVLVDAGSVVEYGQELVAIEPAVVAPAVVAPGVVAPIAAAEAR